MYSESNSIEDHLRNQIRMRNSHIDKLQKEIQEKNQVILSLKNQQSSYPNASTSSGNDENIMRHNIEQEFKQKYDSAIRALRTRMDQQTSEIVALKQENNRLMNHTNQERTTTSSVSLSSENENLKKEVNYLKQQYKDVTVRCQNLQEQLNHPSKERNVPKSNINHINHNLILSGIPSNQRKGHNGTTPKNPPKYPPGTFPLSLLTSKNHPIVFFVPFNTTPTQCIKFLFDEFNDICSKIRNNQHLYGYSFNQSCSLIKLQDEPILQSEFIKPYRTRRLIAAICFEDTPNLKKTNKKSTIKNSTPSPDISSLRNTESSTINSRGRNRASTEFVVSDIRKQSSRENFFRPISPERIKFNSTLRGPQIKKEPNVIPITVVVDDDKYQIKFPGSANVETMKRIIIKKLNPNLNDSELVSQSVRYNLKVTGTGYFLTGGEITVEEFPIVKFCQKKQLTPMISLLTKEQSKNDKLISKMIGSILSDPSGSFTFNWRNIEDSDASDFRIKMSRILGDRETNYSPDMLAETVITPPGLRITPIPPLTIRVYLEKSEDISHEGIRVTIQVQSSSSAFELIPQVCKKFSIATKQEFQPDKYALKIAGQASYIHPESKLGDLKYVQNCTKNKKNIYFVLVEREMISCLKKMSRGGLNNANTWATDTPFTSSTVGHFGDSETISLLELKSKFEFKVSAVTNLHSQIKKSEQSILSFYITAGIYFGSEQIPSNTNNNITILNTTSENNNNNYNNNNNLLETSALPMDSSGTVTWRQWLRSSIRICDIPEDSRICITLWAKNQSTTTAIANVNCSLFDFKDNFRTGRVYLRMWLDGEANPIGTCMENLRLSKDIVPTLELNFHSYPNNVVYPVLKSIDLYDFLLQYPSPSENSRIKVLVNTDPLYRLTKEDKLLLWKYKEWIRMNSSPRALVKIIQCVQWENIQKVREIYRLLEIWVKIAPEDALQLLDAQFANRKVREYAVHCLDILQDYKLKDYLLQLVQALKYEPNHFSPLAVWLLTRCLKNPLLLGTEFFWMLKAELHVPEISERYALLLEMYLRGCGEQREDLYKQTRVVGMLNDVAVSIKSVPSSKRKQEVQKRLAQLNLPSSFQLPLDPKRRACGLVIEKCKSMDSAKAPLWLVFKNLDPRGDNIWLIFKSGDDLRQDLLTLQMLGIMDNIWKEELLDLCLTPYKCTSTGDEMGMIETVLDSTTTANIQKAAGGVTGALKQTPLANWLRKYNPGECKYLIIILFNIYIYILCMNY